MSDILSLLNQSQKEAVTDFEHPLLVLAGAGSGKTRVITSKIAYALKEKGYNPWQILAVTFTNKAAKEMKERVETMLGGPLPGLEIRTFHSFGAMLLRKYGTHIGLSSSFTIYDDAESLELLSMCYPEVKKTTLKPYIKEISRVKDKGLNSDSPAIRASELYLPDFRAYFKSYESALASSGCADFADLICRVSELLDGAPDVKKEINNRYRLILVDEYQDSNGAQFQLLKAIAGTKTQVVVVGDDDQSIYRFRGAELKNILNFPNDYPGTRTIKLEENYRSTKNILRIASSVISHNKERHEKTIFTNNPEGSLPTLLVSENAKGEAEIVANRIALDRSWSSTAILYRTNAQSRDFETELTRNRIPYQVIGALRFYEREEVKDVLAVLSYLLNPKDLVSFKRIINKPARGIGPTSVDKILSLSSDAYEALNKAVDGKFLTKKVAEGAASFLAFSKQALELIDKNESAVSIMNYIIEGSGLKAHYAAEEDETIKRSRLENLSELVNAVESLEGGRAGLTSFLENVTLDNTVIGDRDLRDEEGVKLMTMHTTKGLEFDRVFVTGLEDGLIPGSGDLGSEDIEEERRIFYVAVTRARKELFLSYSLSRAVFGSYSSQRYSRFLEEIPKECYNGKLVSNFYAHSFSSSYFRPGQSVARGNIYSERPKVVVVKKAEASANLKTPVKWHEGDRALSPDYGEGTITSVEDRGNGKIVIRVRYDSGKETLYVAAFANLKKI